MTTLSSLQTRTLGRGMTATVQRVKDRSRTVIVIEHPETVSSRELLTTIKHGLYASGQLRQGSSDVSLGDPSSVAELQEALHRSEAQVEHLRQQLAAIRFEVDARPPVAPTPERKTEGITLNQFAQRHSMSYATAWRALNQGRLKGEVVAGGEKKSHWVVFPETYVPAPNKRK